MSGISDKAIKTGYAENKYRFNKGSELNNDLDLNWYETVCRTFDPQIGRFLQSDALSFITLNLSPYEYSNNNPILYNDPLGLLSTPNDPQVLQTVTVVGHKKSYGIIDLFSDLINHNYERIDNHPKIKELVFPFIFPMGTHMPLNSPTTLARINPTEVTVGKEAQFYKDQFKIALLTIPEIAAEDLVLEGLLLEGAGEDLGAESFMEEQAATEETAQAASASNNLPDVTLRISKHAAQRMGERGITKAMIRAALKKGTKYFDPKNKTIAYVLEKAFASGKSLIVSANQWNGTITTVERVSNLNVLRRMLLMQ